MRYASRRDLGSFRGGWLFEMIGDCFALDNAVEYKTNHTTPALLLIYRT